MPKPEEAVSECMIPPAFTRLLSVGLGSGVTAASANHCLNRNLPQLDVGRNRKPRGSGGIYTVSKANCGKGGNSNRQRLIASGTPSNSANGQIGDHPTGLAIGISDKVGRQ